ncbi:MAG: sle [Blastococcus sp.]|jgi:hypothetical protein|nr:sle [Blastococcus sp.]
MTSANPGMTSRTTSSKSTDGHAPVRRLTTETKAAYKTTEMAVYLAAVAAVLIASQVIGTEAGHNDYFRADKAWFYVVLLTIGYLISRGLAKSGSRDPYNDR